MDIKNDENLFSVNLKISLNLLLTKEAIHKTVNV